MGRNKGNYECKICGETSPDMFYVGRKNKCKTCICDESKLKYLNMGDKGEYIKKQREWRSENVLHYRVESAKHRSKRNGLIFELTDDIIKSKIDLQGGLCYISKQPISYKENDWNSLSLDRLDSNLGYTIDNTIVVTKFVNISKNNLSLYEYINLIKLVCENIK
jgi:hypothetical protein